MTREDFIIQIENYAPFNEQEEKDKALILGWISNNENAFSRENTVAHITASAWVVNKDRSKVLMVYHNIYNSWSWMGGHADGETDLLSVAIREVTGIRGDFFSGISDGGRTCEKRELCVQPFASEYHVFTGGRFGRAGIRKSR